MMWLAPQLATNIRVHLGQPGHNGQSVVLSVILEPSLVIVNVSTAIRVTMDARVRPLSSCHAQMLFVSSGQSGVSGQFAVSLASVEFEIGSDNALVRLDRVKVNPVKQVTVSKATVLNGQIGALPANARSHAVVVYRNWSASVSTEKLAKMVASEVTKKLLIVTRNSVPSGTTGQFGQTAQPRAVVEQGSLGESA